MIYLASNLIHSPSIYTLAKLSSPTLCLFLNSNKPFVAITCSPSKMKTSPKYCTPSFKPLPTSLSAFYINFKHFPKILMHAHSLLNFSISNNTLTMNSLSFTTTSTLLLLYASSSHTTISNFKPSFPCLNIPFTLWRLTSKILLHFMHSFLFINSFANSHTL